jgi:hypothetical protein
MGLAAGGTAAVVGAAVIGARNKRQGESANGDNNGGSDDDRSIVTVDGDENQDVRMKVTLDLPFFLTGTEGSKDRAQFKRQFRRDLSEASGHPKDLFVVLQLSRGSVVVETAILSQEGKEGADAHRVLCDLEQQAHVDDSPLRQGKLTRHTTGIKFLGAPDVPALELPLPEEFPEVSPASDHRLIARVDPLTLGSKAQVEYAIWSKNVAGTKSGGSNGVGLFFASLQKAGEYACVYAYIVSICTCIYICVYMHV